MQVLRAALDDNRENYAAKYIAQALMHGRCMEPEVTACLDAWDHMAFKWRQHGMTEASIAEAVRRSGIMRLARWMCKPCGGSWPTH